MRPQPRSASAMAATVAAGLGHLGVDLARVGVAPVGLEQTDSGWSLLLSSSSTSSAVMMPESARKLSRK